MTHPEKWAFDGFYSRLKPHKGDVYRPGECLPEPQHQTAAGRKQYTVQQIRAAYSQGVKDSRTLLTRCRNMLSHPAHWGAEESVVAARYKLYTEVLEHLNGLENCEASTKREKRVFREQLKNVRAKPLESTAAPPSDAEARRTANIDHAAEKLKYGSVGTP
jgi:hypothetical protein